MNTSFYDKEELKSIGLKSFGRDVYISKKVSLYSPENIIIGDYVRIDDFCILSGEIKIGSFVHIAAYCALYGKYGIEIEDYVGLSAKTIIYSASDDFSGEFLFGPTVPEEFKNVKGGKVIIKKYSIIGASCVVFPSITIGEGVAVGAMSLVKGNLESWGIYAGIPAKFIKKRSLKLIEREKLLKQKLGYK